MVNEKSANYSSAFHIYDIRGKVGEQLDEQLALAIGYHFFRRWGKDRVVVGRDARLSSPALQAAVTAGIRAAGGRVWDIGLCGTEMVYFAVNHLQADGGIMITASHNPAEYNGMKLVLDGARPLISTNGLYELRDAAVAGCPVSAAGVDGGGDCIDISDQYIAHLLTYVDRAAIRPLTVVANAGNGCAGTVMEKLAGRLPIRWRELNYRPDGSFPHGVPNPLLVENRAATARAVVESKADLGIAWDGDFDRCFFFTGDGQFVEGYYLVGLLAKAILGRAGGGRVIYEPRLVWNTEKIVRECGGTPVLSRTGHGFIKEAMRTNDAVYGGEMSAHHYFRDFGYCDSGMIPWLLVVEMMSREGKSLSELVGAMQAQFPCSGEINFRVADSQAVLADLEQHYARQAVNLHHIDGLSVEMENWRFNVRASATESFLRLNLETRGDREMLTVKTDEISRFISRYAADSQR
ncbi:MAG: phosphomannomutase [Negativicutes bacterium]|nr:phosphomannomutase [Negativicutes bacterium]